MLTVLTEASRLSGSLQRHTSSASVVTSLAKPPPAGAAPSSASFLLSSVRVVASLLQLLAEQGGGAQQASYGGQGGDWLVSCALLPPWRAGGGSASAVWGPSFRTQSILHSNFASAANQSAAAAGTSLREDGFGAVCVSLISHLAALWNGLTLQSDSIRSTATILPALQCIAESALSLCVTLCRESLPSPSPGAIAFDELLANTFFAYFPYTSVDASIAVQGSVEEVFARKHLEALNTTLCEVALSWNHHCDRYQGWEAHSGYSHTALDFVTAALQRLNARMQGGGVGGMSEVTYRLLRCVSLQGRRGEAGLDSVLLQLGHLLRTQLHTISRAVATSTGASGGKKRRVGGGGKEVLLPVTVLLAAVRCVSEITHTDFLWAQDGGESSGTKSRADSLAYVAEAVSQIPTQLVVALGDEESVEDSVSRIVNDVLAQCAEVLLLLMRRVAVWGLEDGEGQGGDWSSQVLTVNKRVEELFDSEQAPVCVYMCSSGSVRRSWADLWMHCPLGTDTARSAAVVMQCLCAADVSAAERSYFLDMLFER